MYYLFQSLHQVPEILNISLRKSCATRNLSCWSVESENSKVTRLSSFFLDIFMFRYIRNPRVLPVIQIYRTRGCDWFSLSFPTVATPTEIHNLRLDFVVGETANIHRISMNIWRYKLPYCTFPSMNSYRKNLRSVNYSNRAKWIIILDSWLNDDNVLAFKREALYYRDCRWRERLKEVASYKWPAKNYQFPEENIDGPRYKLVCIVHAGINRIR